MAQPSNAERLRAVRVALDDALHFCAVVRLAATATTGWEDYIEAWEVVQKRAVEHVAAEAEVLRDERRTPG